MLATVFTEQDLSAPPHCMVILHVTTDNSDSAAPINLLLHGTTQFRALLLHDCRDDGVVI